MPRSSEWGMSKKSQKLRKSTKASKRGKDGLLASTKPRLVDSRLDAALRRLQVSQEELVRHPNITDMLKKAIGSRERIINMMRFSSDPSIEAFLDIHDRIPVGDQPVIPLEAICIKGKVNAMALLGATVAVAQQVSKNESMLQTVIQHPDVVKKTIEFALESPKNVLDRKMIHEAVGWLPKSTGISISQHNEGAKTLNVTPVQQMQGQPTLPEQTPEDAFATAFPSVTASLEKWGTNRRKMLSAPKVEAPFIPMMEGELVEAEAEDV